MLVRVQSGVPGYGVRFIHQDRVSPLRRQVIGGAGYPAWASRKIQSVQWKPRPASTSFAKWQNSYATACKTVNQKLVQVQPSRPV